MFKKIGIGMAVFMVAVLSIFLFCSPIIAQEEVIFSDNFEEPSLEGYEYSQGVLVFDGVLRMDPGGSIFRSGNWSNPSFSFKMRTSSPSHDRIKYHASDEGNYSIDIFSEDQHAEIALNKEILGKETGLFSKLLDNFIVDDWNTIEVSFDGLQHQVIMNDQTIFTFEDQEPLKSGAIGFEIHKANGLLEIDDFLIKTASEVLPVEGEEDQLLEEDAQDEAVITQEVVAFSDSFEEPSMEGYEYSENILVSDGVLRIDVGGFIFRSGNWSNPSFSFKMRTSSPSSDRIKYHNSDEGYYSIDIFSDIEDQYAEISLTKVMSGNRTGLFSKLLDNFIVDDWNTIEVSYDGLNHLVVMNDQFIFNAEDQEPLKSGSIGFMVEAHGSLEIDDFLIKIASEVLPVEGEEGQLLEEDAQDGAADTQEGQAGIDQTQDTYWKEFLNGIFVSGGKLGLNVYITLLGIIIAVAIHLSFAKKASRSKKIEIILMHAIGISAFMSIVSFIGHAFFADTLANSIGWPAGNPFQLEVAGANLGIGLIGYLGYWRRDFWLPYIIVRTCFMWTAATIHIIEIVKSSNFSPGNAGPILYWDILWPILLAILYIIHIKMESGETSKGYFRTRPLAGKKVIK